MPAGPVLFVDRSAWSKALDASLREQGIEFVAHRDRFPHDAPDDEWLSLAGKRKWPVITRDKRIRYVYNEWEAYRRASVLGFVFTAGDISARKTAEALIAAYPKIGEIAASVSRPAMYSIDRNGEVRPLELAARRQPR